MKRYDKLHSISVITSSICNLNCKFCYLHKNEAYKEYHKLLTQAWEDGSYVNNIVQCITKLGHKTTEVEEINFWGGETLIQLDKINKNVKEFYHYFPNLNEWHMSTNWVIDIDKFFELLLEIEKYTNTSTKMVIQISIDGPPGEISDVGHNGWEFYQQNFEKFLNLMNNHRFNKVNVFFHFKSTLSKELYIKSFSSKEGILSYMKYMVNFITNLEQKCISRSVNFREKFTIPSLARPHIYSKEEGEQLRNIMYLWESVASEFNEKIPFMFGMTEFNMDRYFTDNNIECGEMVDRYTINFDGTIVECSGVLIDYYEPYRQELLKEGNIQLYEQSLVNAKHTFNPIHATQEEIEKWKWRIEKGYRNNSLTYASLMSAVAYELLLSNQIPSYYYDEEMLFKHLQSFQGSNGCSKENFQTTGSSFVTSVGNIREYFNGVMDYGYKMREKSIRENYKYTIPKEDNHQGENIYEYNVGR